MSTNKEVKDGFLEFQQDYKKTPLLCGGSPGIFDTVNNKYPEIWDIYKEMKSLDWDENEVSYESCIGDFKRADKATYDAMIKTLTWQWEADSAVSRLGPLLAPFISSSELWAAWQRISDNEVLHAITYSEIVRNSFENPQVIMDEILNINETFNRLDIVEQTLEDAFIKGRKYDLGEISHEEAYEIAIVTIAAILCLERIQFISSFAVTFAIAQTGIFEPIGTIVQKIAQDELEVHVKLDKAVLRHELATERGKKVFEKNKQKINEIIDAVVLKEMEWTKYLFSDGRSLVGLNYELLSEFAMFNAKDVYNFFGMKPIADGIYLPEKNPLPYMNKWLDMSAHQPSPMEQDITQYKTSVMVRDDDGMEFDF